MSSRAFRSVVMAAGVLLASAGPASGEVGDATLLVRCAASAPGRQSVTIRLTTTPRPAQRTRTTGTLTIGAAVVSLDVTISRTGRVSTRARRVTLATLPDFGVARLDLAEPIDAGIEFVATDCVPRSHGRVLECPKSAGLPGPPPDGVYDADIERIAGNQHWPIAPALAAVLTGSDGTRELDIRLSMFDALWLIGAPGGSTATLTGHSITGGDIYAQASGSATSSHGTTASYFDGTAASAVFGTPLTWSFALRRPESGTPAALGGTWVVHFTGGSFVPSSGDVILDLAIPPDGHATTAPSTFTASGQTLFAIGAGTCLVSPAGATSCSLPTEPYYGIVMHGALDLSSSTGSGRFYLGLPPAIYSEGTWTAERP